MDQESEVPALQFHVFGESKSDMVLNSQQNKCPAGAKSAHFEMVLHEVTPTPT